MKGVLYRGTQEFFRDHVTGGIEALHAELERDPPLLAFIKQQFLPSSWYDVLPVAPLIRAEARAMRLTLTHYLRLRARYQAERDIRGVYRFLVTLASPDAVAQRLPRVMAQMFDFVKTESRIIEPGRVEMTIHGFPAVLVEWYSGCFSEYADVALRLAGARWVTITSAAPVPQEMCAGVPLVTIAIEALYA